MSLSEWWERITHSKDIANMEKNVLAIKKLPLMVARTNALLALEKPACFAIEREPLETPLLVELPDSVRDFFRNVKAISVPGFEFLLSRQEIGPSICREGFIRIGEDSDNSEYVIEPRKNPVYEFNGDDDEDQRAISHGGFPSIYHLILVTEEVLFPRT